MFGGVGIFCFIRFSQPLPLGEGPRYMVSFLTLSRGSGTMLFHSSGGKKKFRVNPQCKVPKEWLALCFLLSDHFYEACG